MIKLIDKKEINGEDLKELLELRKKNQAHFFLVDVRDCLLYTSPSPRD